MKTDIEKKIEKLEQNPKIFAYGYDLEEALKRVEVKIYDQRRYAGEKG